MNILFLTLVSIKSFEEKHNIYSDLCREFVNRGHTVNIVCPDENDGDTVYEPYKEHCGILRVKTGKVQKTNIIRKGINTLLLGTVFKRAIRSRFKNERFDLVIYSTPPITLYTIVAYLKKRQGCTTYLLLKDIFPQNAVDLGMMCKRGPKSVIYHYFRHKEKQLYAISDSIGCMSQRNKEYLLLHNPEIPEEKVHVSPNSFEPTTVQFEKEEKTKFREKYGIPLDKTVFVYGGNIGKPQGVSFIIDCLERVKNRTDSYFVICGNGTDYPVLEKYIHSANVQNILLIPGLPRDEYEEFVGCCDVGLIFLDKRFTIPNFPSRLLSHMQKSMPVIACTDRNTDFATTITEGGFGWWCESDHADDFVRLVDEAVSADLQKMGQTAAQYLIDHFSCEKSAKIILDKVKR